MNFLLNVLVTIGILISPSKKSFVFLKSIKWYAYCHFKPDGLNYDALSCGKCFNLFEPSNNLENDQKSNLAHLLRNGFYENYTNSTPWIDTKINSDLSIQNATVQNSVKRNNHCDLFEDFVNENNRYHYTINENDLNVQETFPLMPILTQNWFNYDLLYLIEKFEIVSNLKDFELYSKIAENLRVIELNNFGIESIGRDAFKQFKNLRVLKLNNNRISSIELSSFMLDDVEIDYDDSEYKENSLIRNNSIKSRLVELDLSYNRLINLKLENFICLDNLRMLNFSHNMIKKFDLNFISAAVPRLKSLDLSFNFLRNFKIQDSYVYYYADPASFLQTVNQSAKNSQRFSLITSPILKKMTFLNLNGK